MIERKLKKELDRLYKVIGGKGTLLNCSLAYAFYELANEVIKTHMANEHKSTSFGRAIAQANELVTAATLMSGFMKEQKRILDDIQWRIVMLEEKQKNVQSIKNFFNDQLSRTEEYRHPTITSIFERLTNLEKSKINLDRFIYGQQLLIERIEKLEAVARPEIKKAKHGPSKAK